MRNNNGWELSDLDDIDTIARFRRQLAEAQATIAAQAAELAPLRQLMVSQSAENLQLLQRVQAQAEEIIGLRAALRGNETQRELDQNFAQAKIDRLTDKLTSLKASE